MMHRVVVLVLVIVDVCMMAFVVVDGAVVVIVCP